jgi:putative PIN family toxin of toxin-antitoxin system
MTDTNILISAILFPNSRISKVLWDILLKHELVLCSHIIDELHIVFDRKFKDKKLTLENFLLELSYELIYTPQCIDVEKYPSIRDNKDLPVLVSAIVGEVDVLITGDKDFDDIVIDKPNIIKPSEYVI